MTFFSVPFPIFVGNNYSGNSADAPLCSRLNALFERRMVFSVSMYFRRLDIYLRVISLNALEKSGEVRNFAAFYWLAREKERERERKRERSDFVSHGVAVLRAEIRSNDNFLPSSFPDRKKRPKWKR